MIRFCLAFGILRFRLVVIVKKNDWMILESPSNDVVAVSVSSLAKFCNKWITFVQRIVLVRMKRHPVLDCELLQFNATLVTRNTLENCEYDDRNY